MMIGAAVLFGTTGTAQALGPADSNPLSVGAIRLAIGGGLLAAIGIVSWIATQGLRWPRLSGKASWILLGGLFIMLFQATFFFGTKANGVAVGTAVALGSSPLFAGIFEWIRGRRPTGRWAVATGVAVMGLVALSGIVGAASQPDPWGLLASLIAGASYAAYAVAASIVLDRGLSSLITTSGILGVSGVLALAVLPFTDNSWLIQPSGIVMATWLGVATVVFSYLLVGYALTHLSAATAITLGLAEPLTAAALGVLVLNEHLSFVQWLGLMAVLAGVVIAGSNRTPAAALNG